MSDITIYYNPKCFKSREGLAYLEKAGIQPTVIKYMDEGLSASQIITLLSQLGLEARALLRSHEDMYKELGLDDPALSDEALIQAMVNNPRLIHRPIMVRGNQAVLGQSPEAIQTFLDSAS